MPKKMKHQVPDPLLITDFPILKEKYNCLITDLMNHDICTSNSDSFIMLQNICEKVKNILNMY